MSDTYNKDVRAIVKPETTVFLSPPVGKPGRMGAIQLLLKAEEAAEGSYEFTLLRNLEQDTADLIDCVGLVIEAPDNSCADLGDIVVITGKRINYLLATGIAGSIRGLRGRTGAIQFLLEYSAVDDNKQYFNILKSFDPNFKAADIQQVCGLVIKKTAVDDSIKVGDIVAFTGISFTGPYITIGASTGGVLGNILGDTFNDLLDRIAENKQDIAENKQDIAENKQDIAENAKDIAENSKEISNIYTILGETVIGTEEVVGAYSERQTANGLVDLIDGAFTKVTEIKGNTVRCENLVDLSNTLKSVDEVTVAYDPTDGKFNFSGTPTTGYINLGSVDITSLLTAGKTYTLSQTKYFSSYAADGAVFAVLVIDGATTGAPRTDDGEISFTVKEGSTYRLTIQTGGSLATINSKIGFMLNDGLTAKPFQPYFAGLKHASISGIKSTGRNLIPYPYNAASFTSEGITWTVNSDGSIAANGTATGNSIFVIQKASNFILPAGTYTVSGANDGSQSTYNIQIGATPVVGGTPAYYNATNGTKITLTEPCKILIQAVVYNGYTANGLKFYPMKNYGETALPFEPYIEDTYQLPQTLELGLGDTFNPQTGEFVKGTETIILDGSKAWITEREDKTISGWYAKPEHWAVYGTTINIDNAFVSSKALNANSANYNFHKVFPAGTTREEVQAYFNGIVVAGKLKTPTTGTIENVPKYYTARKYGTETIEGNANEKHGANPTITNIYAVKKGV